MNIELFQCSGGLAEGFRRAGLTFDRVFDMDADACESYFRNHGHRPEQLDVNVLLEQVKRGEREELRGADLLSADPPCTPWSRAGKRKGLEDERDCLHVTAELIRQLRPRAALIGNLPGLQDSTSWGVVQRVIGGLAADGYCVRDYFYGDSASYGVPQHRLRPFWFMHLDGPCVAWPAPTHGKATAQMSIGDHALIPWVTCRQALGHIPLAQLGRPVEMTIRPRGQDGRKNGGDVTRCSSPDHPATTVVSKDTRKGGAILLPNEKHPMRELDEPAKTVTAHLGATGAAQGGAALKIRSWDNHPPSDLDEPAHAVKTNGDRIGTGGGTTLRLSRSAERRSHSSAAAEPSKVITTNDMGEGATLMVDPVAEWPWARPATTIQGDERLGLPGLPGLPGHHDPKVGNSQHGPNAIILSERCAAILQGFPDGECAGHDPFGAPVPHAGAATGDGVRPGDACKTCGNIRRWHFVGKTKKSRWNQLGMAMPPPFAHAVAASVVGQMRRARA